MEWIRGQSIGHGTFAKVSLAKPTSQNPQFPSLIALKSCALSHSATLINEFKILNQLQSCPEIITCYGDSITVENNEKLYNIALEYASYGSLADKLKNLKNSALLETDVRRYTKSVLKGLEFIHRNGFVHCDIKPENILLFSDDSVKVADFGLARRITKEVNLEYDVRGTPLYMSPETVVYGKQLPASDIWAVGCLVLEMLTGKPAWTCSDMSALLMKIGVGAEIPEIPGNLSEAGRDFIGKCFVKDASERWTAEMLLKHPFINGEDWVLVSSPRDPFDFPDWELERSVVGVPELEMELELECWETSVSSREKFDFPDWELEERVCVAQELELELELKRWETGVSAMSRLKRLVTEEVPDWSVASGWVTGWVLPLGPCYCRPLNPDTRGATSRPTSTVHCLLENLIDEGLRP
ncbi:hypothetical protein QVD17_36809 [Tagetes erecta]|uniref:Protein kinase domain-containing protein n=1 Tax=Tagetes erecta TaxID=13708 RepID=A0AAD8JT39_TARER|nr:hypothetical protein QVD17_36809 [Tagetes erecta]